LNTVHPTAVLGDDVTLGDGNVIGAFAVLLGPLRLGDGNWIGAHTVLGGPAEIRGIEHGGPEGGVGTGIEIGSNNVFREHVTVHQGHYARTRIGNDCYLMNRVYVGHDGEIGDGVTMASGVTLGGHVHVGAGANLGMNATVHQRRIVGPLAMVGMAAVVTHDIPPFAKAFGNPVRVRGVNRVGLQRQGADDATISALDSALEAPLDEAGAGGDDPALDGLPDQLQAAVRWWQAETDQAVRHAG